MKTVKKILVIILCLVFTSPELFSQEIPSLYPVHQPWDMGSIKKGRMKEKVFFIKNIGNKDLIIKRVHSCCGYNIVDVSAWEVKPNKKVKLIISVDSSRKNAGKDEKVITIDSNDNANPIYKIPISSFIVDPAKK